MCRDNKKLARKMRTNIENAHEDRDFYQNQLFKAKKVNKALILEIEKTKDVPLMITGGIMEEEEEKPQLSIKNEEEKADSPRIEDSIDKIFETEPPPIQGMIEKTREK